MSERDAHPDEGTIHAWLDRQLDDTSAATLETHLQRCDECAERVAEARGLIAGASRILSSLDIDTSPASDKPAAEAWRPVVLPATKASRARSFRLTPARSAIAAVLVVAVATAIVHEYERPSSRLASIAAESAAVANAPAVMSAPAMPPAAGAPVATAPMVADAATSPAVTRLDSTAGTRLTAARTFARAQRETTVNADLARVAQVQAPAASAPTAQVVAAAKAADSAVGAAAAPMTELRGRVAGVPATANSGVAGGVSAPRRAASSIEAPQCYRVESATGTDATWGPVALPFVLALDRPATSNAARVLTAAGQESDARAVFERRAGDSLLFTLRRLGFNGTLAVGAPGEVRAGVMRSAPAAMNLESVVVTATGTTGDERRALRKSPSAAQARADSAPKAPEREAAPAVPVVVRQVECKR